MGKLNQAQKILTYIGLIKYVQPDGSSIAARLQTKLKFLITVQHPGVNVS
jgi:hypothetical protein